MKNVGPCPPRSATYYGLRSPANVSGLCTELFDLAKPSKEMVDRAEKSLAEAGFKAETVLRKGGIREVILNTAQEWKTDLIVLGSHSRVGAKRFLLGSVSEPVARHAPWSVEIVRNSNGQ